jgi:hypothetical protein
MVMMQKLKKYQMVEMVMLFDKLKTMISINTKIKDRREGRGE